MVVIGGTPSRAAPGEPAGIRRQRRIPPALAPYSTAVPGTRCRSVTMEPYAARAGRSTRSVRLGFQARVQGPGPGRCNVRLPYVGRAPAAASAPYPWATISWFAILVGAPAQSSAVLALGTSAAAVVFAAGRPGLSSTRSSAVLRSSNVRSPRRHLQPVDPHVSPWASRPAIVGRWRILDLRGSPRCDRGTRYPCGYPGRSRDAPGGRTGGRSRGEPGPLSDHAGSPGPGDSVAGRGARPPGGPR
jgi:hypothetical protein